MGNLAPLLPGSQDLITQVCAALTDLNTALEEIHPAVTWQQGDWEQHTRKLRDRLGSGRLRQLLDCLDEGLELATQPLAHIEWEDPRVEHLEWIYDVHVFIRLLRLNDVPYATGWLAELLNPQISSRMFASMASRWHLPYDRLRRDINTLLDLLRRLPVGEGVSLP